MQTTITLGAITTAATTKGSNIGSKYTVAKGSIMHTKDGTEKPVTVMAFGAQRESVLKMLRKGKKVTLTTVWDGKNVLKVLGPQQDAPAAAEG